MPGIESAKKRCYEEEKPPVISTVDPKVVLENVLKQLGKPKDLSAEGPSLTRATPITQSSFRVQIYRCVPPKVEEGWAREATTIFPTNTLTDWFFVNVNKEGGIVRSNPAIVGKYLEN